MNVSDLYNWDYNKTLFPLESNRLAIRFGEKELCQYLAHEYELHSQTPVCALKRNGHHRNTVKLDPLMDYMLYSFILDSQSLFQNPNVRFRTVLGYDFSKTGEPSSTAKSYNRFQDMMHQYRSDYRHFIRLDIKSYFNSIQLNDFMCWLKEIGIQEDNLELLRRCLLNVTSQNGSGFLPQGIYPAKVLGSHYLSFLEEPECLLSERSLRFVDDIYLFSNSKNILHRDLHEIQHTLRERGLNINESKTHIGGDQQTLIFGSEDSIHANLFRKRLKCFEISDSETLFEGTNYITTQFERDYIVEKADRINPDEQDIPLLLTFLRDDADRYIKLYEHIIYNYPFHTKSLYFFTKYITDHASLSSLIYKFLDVKKTIAEYQLFWLTKIAIHLKNKDQNIALLLTIYHHPSACDSIKAKILELPTDNAELLDLGRLQLANGSSKLLTWCAAFGQRNTVSNRSNLSFKQFADSSTLGSTIAKIVKKVAAS